MKNAVILIPSYEPDKILINTIEGILKEQFPVLLVNDGSDASFDNIFDIAKNLDGVSYLKTDKNKGKGAALKYGFSELIALFPNAKYVITVDGDGQHSISDIIKIYDKLNETNELVFGVRSFDDKTPNASKFGNGLSRVTRSWSTKKYLKDDQCGLRGFPIRYIDELIHIAGNKYEYEMNQIVIFQLKQNIIETVPIKTIYLDQNSKSHFSPVRDTLRIQYRIFEHSIISIILNALLISLIIQNQYFHFNIWLNLLICYFGVSLLYFLIMLIVNRLKKPLYFLRREIIFTAIKYICSSTILFLLIDLLGLDYHIFIPIIVIIFSLINIPLAKIFKNLK